MAGAICNIFLALNGREAPEPCISLALKTARQFGAGITAVLMDGHSSDEATIAGSGLGAGAVRNLVSDSHQRLSDRMGEISHLLARLEAEGQLCWKHEDNNKFFPPCGLTPPHLQFFLSSASLPQTLTRYGQLSDVVIMPQPTASEPPITTSLRRAILRQKCLPLLLASPLEGVHAQPSPPDQAAAPESLLPFQRPIKQIGLLWEGTLQSARLLHLALPWLNQAENVHLFPSPLHQESEFGLTVQHGLDYLHLHGVQVHRAPETAAHPLSDQFRQLELDLLLAPLQAQGNLRSLISGPDTGLLAHCGPLPVLTCG